MPALEPPSTTFDAVETGGEATGLSLEDLPAEARAAVQQIQHWLRHQARVPVYALVASTGPLRQAAAQVLAQLEGGLYLDLAEYVRGQVVSDSTFRTEWITAGYLSTLVIELARASDRSPLVIGGWEMLLGLIERGRPGSALNILRALVYRALPTPIVLVFAEGPTGFGGMREVRTIMESEGRARIAMLMGFEDDGR